ncbi:MAG TPA: hypothetical protein VHG09_14685 [Longimicrobiales bacterium]|nr:hypothetical protein [Longimicrobiales bacterium]
MQRPRSTLVRGAIAGAIGAATLAVFFLIVDLLRGTPLATPAFLASVTAGRDAVDTSALLIALYTVIHFAVFIAFGIAVTWVIERVRIRPHFLVGAILGFLLFDMLFYAGVVVTGVDVVRALGWPEVLAGNVIAGIAMFGWLQATSAEGTPTWGHTFTGNRVIREGIIAGVIGAASVAVWFLIIDVIAGRLFYTPAALGSAVFLQAESPETVSMSAGIIAGYTLFHVLAFIAVGILAAALVLRAEVEPSVLLGAVLLFVTLEAFAIGLIAILAAWLLDTIGWWTVAAANLIAAVTMGTYLWRAHPALREELGRESLEEPAPSSRSEAA